MNTIRNTIYAIASVLMAVVILGTAPALYWIAFHYKIAWLAIIVVGALLGSGVWAVSADIFANLRRSQ